MGERGRDQSEPDFRATVLLRCIARALVSTRRTIPVSGIRQILSDKMWTRVMLMQSSIAGPHENCVGVQIAPKFYIGCLIADYQRFAKVESEVGGCLFGQPGLRLAALAVVGRRVWAVVDRG